MIERIVQLFCSLKLTVVCLALALVLVFLGTLAQVEQGLYAVQERYFQSLFVWWSPGGSGLKLPVFPGGYLIGVVLLLNLVAGHVRRFRFSRRAWGLWMIHLGLILLLLGQVATDRLSVESAMRLEVGETKHYSESAREHELAIVDVSDPEHDTVIAVPEARLKPGARIDLPGQPLSIRVRRYWPNVQLTEKAAGGAEASGADRGVGARVQVVPRPPTVRLEERDLPASTLEVYAGESSLGKWLVSPWLLEAQRVEHGGRTYEIALRSRRQYAPYSITLLDCRHDVYKGTEIPRNFSSRVRVRHPERGEDREVLIFMNNPLRYGGATYYQYQMDTRPARAVSTLQVVRNPGWLTPYVSCVLVGLGLLVQFGSHLSAFLKRKQP